MRFKGAVASETTILPRSSRFPFSRTLSGTIVLVLLSAMFLTVLGAPAFAGSPSVNKQKMLEFNNAERNARGIRPLSRNSALDAEAQRWAEKLAAEGRMYHRSSTYALSVGFRSGAENLAWHDHSISASQAHNMWMQSASHRRNMLDPAMTAAGFGIACSTKSGRAYAIAVVEFGGDSPPAQSTPPSNPHVAGGTAVDGVGCSDRDTDAPAEPSSAGRLAPQTTTPDLPSKSSVGAPTAAAPSTPNKTSSRMPSGPPADGSDEDSDGSAKGPGSPSRVNTVPSKAPVRNKPQSSKTGSDLGSSDQGKESPPPELGERAADVDQTNQDQTAQQEKDSFSDRPEDASDMTAASARSSQRPMPWPVILVALALAWGFLLRVFGFRRPAPRRHPRHSYR
ncbi:MAG: CAP domain-containing protein [Actinomycetota bacterium]|nr:CAP domain-containing protein [Actinomycetota bacterium]